MTTKPTMDRVRVEMLETDIINHGQVVVVPSVVPEDEMPFGYTIGNWRLKLPELLMVAPFHPNVIAAILHDLGATMRNIGEPFPEGAVITPSGISPVQIVNATCPTARLLYTVRATEFWSDETYRVQQVLPQDPRGRWPLDPECEHPFSDIRILKAN